MAREPYRTHMDDMLSYGSEEARATLMRRFVIEEAGSSHSDVIARDNLERLYEDLHRRAYVRPRYYVEFFTFSGYDDPDGMRVAGPEFGDVSGYWVVRAYDNVTNPVVPTRFTTREKAQVYADWMERRR